VAVWNFNLTIGGSLVHQILELKGGFIQHLGIKADNKGKRIYI